MILKKILGISSLNLIAQILPFTFLPVLTRLYSVQDFGLLAVYMSLVLVLTAVSTFRLEYCLYEDNSDIAKSRVATIVLFVCSLSVLIIGAYDLLNDVHLIYYSIAIVSYLQAICNVEICSLTVTGQLKKIGYANIVRTATLVGFQTGFYYITDIQDHGLVYGFLGSTVCYYLYLNRGYLYQPNISETTAFLSKYSHIVKYSFPGGMLNIFAGNVPQLILPLYFTMTDLGFYSLAQRILGAPAALIGTAIGQIYSNDAIKEYKDKKNIRTTFIRFLKYLLAIGMLLFVVLALIIEDVVRMFLDPKWSELARYTVVLMPYFFVNFVVSALCTTDMIIKKNYLYLLLNGGLILSNLSYFLIFESYIFSQYLYYLVLSYSFFYVTYLVSCAILTKEK